jgi:hypothetical protein
MQRPDTLDSRTILRCYTVAAGVVGLVIVLYRWPPPATLTADRVSMTALWSLVLGATGNAVWVSGAVAWQFADIEHPARRLRALRLFAAVLIVVGAFYWAPAFPILRSLFPAGAGWLPIAAGVVLLLASLQPRVFTRGSAVPRSVVTFHDVPGLSLRSRYEEQIRQAARQEERTRLARDLHDAVKQQLFAVQTAAATAETRFDMDPAGARAVDTSTLVPRWDEAPHLRAAGRFSRGWPDRRHLVRAAATIADQWQRRGVTCSRTR